MSDIVVKFKNVSKEYKLYKNDKQKFLAIFYSKIPHKNKLANKDISFQIRKGETVAILGRNGAGKSTLLKLMTGVSAPSSGSIKIDGKVSALLELSSGFESDFTGRENIYLKGSLMGISKNKMSELEKDIMEFAELEEYIDQSVRTYSSGMKARLGFAICISLYPEILIVDEALSVGDEKFKNKCRNKIREIIERDDVTFILVTHSTSLAKDFCDRGIVLHKGTLKYDGKIDDAIEFYKDIVK